MHARVHSTAVELVDAERGEWFVSDTRHGPLVHARLNIGGENSGKLVTLVRATRPRLAEPTEPVWSSWTVHPVSAVRSSRPCPGADLVLAVTEPTVSGVTTWKRLVNLVQASAYPWPCASTRLTSTPR